MTAMNFDRQDDAMKFSVISVISDLTLKFRRNCRQQQSTDLRQIFCSQNPLSGSSL